MIVFQAPGRFVIEISANLIGCSSFVRGLRLVVLLYSISPATLQAGARTGGENFHGWELPVGGWPTCKCRQGKNKKLT